MLRPRSCTREHEEFRTCTIHESNVLRGHLSLARLAGLWSKENNPVLYISFQLTRLSRFCLPFRPSARSVQQAPTPQFGSSNALRPCRCPLVLLQPPHRGTRCVPYPLSQFVGDSHPTSTTPPLFNCRIEVPGAPGDRFPRVMRSSAQLLIYMFSATPLPSQRFH